eukprot:6292404-Prymnesium_polylepis.1
MGTQEHNTRKGARKESRLAHRIRTRKRRRPRLRREDGLLENQRRESAAEAAARRAKLEGMVDPVVGSGNASRLLLCMMRLNPVPGRVAAF